MELALAYETGILRTTDLTRVQRWALAYHLNTLRRDRNERQERLTMEFMAFTNPQFYNALTQSQEEPEEEPMTVAPDFQELDELIRKMEAGAVMVSQNEWDDEEGWA